MARNFLRSSLQTASFNIIFQVGWNKLFWHCVHVLKLLFLLMLLSRGVVLVNG